MEPNMSNKTNKVFIFDDNLEILEHCTDILEDLGCEVKTSPTTNDIEKQISDYMPNLIFMDNWLPDISGIEATQKLKANENLKNIPVIYFSANNNISDLAEEAKAKKNKEKHFDINEFEEITKKFLK